MVTENEKGSIYAVILTYNRLELLKKCLEAVFSQTLKPDQIVVINNGSTDGTLQWLETLQKIKIVSQNNSGSSGGFHTGVRYAYDNGADWVWIMDDDVIPKSNCLEVLFSYSDHSKCLNPIHFDSRGEILDEERWFDITSCNIINLFNQSYNSGKKIWYRNIGSFEGMLISKEIIKEIGYPDKRFFITHDDLIYGYLANKYTNVAVIADAVMNKMEVNKTDKSVYSYHYYYHRNYWLLEEYVAKDLPGFDGYRKRRIISKFFYAAYQIIKENEFNDRWKALKTLWKGYLDYKNKKQGQSF